MISILVEGKGDRKAGPHLVRRILQERLGEYCVRENSEATATAGKGDLIKRFDDLTRLMAGHNKCEGIVVLVDSDNDCAESLARELADRTEAVSSVSVAIVCPVKEFENWFVCSAESICPCEDVPTSDREQSTDPKRWLDECLPNGYRSTLDQAELVHGIDFDVALPRSRSLRRMVNAISQLVHSVHNNTTVFTP